MDEASHLVLELDRCRERLHELRGVVGSGVGLRNGRPTIEIFVAGPGEAELERAIGEIADFDFVLVPESQPAEAQARPNDPEE